MVPRVTRFLVACSLLGSLPLLDGCSTTPKSRTEGRDGAFVHIKSGVDRPHSVLMGLQMARLMADTQDVLVYFDVDGIHAVLRDSPDLTMEPFGSSHAMIRELQSRSVPLYACPGCLKALGKTADQLMDGVRVADKSAFFGFTQGRILTLDY